jgi:hypothetical protein
VSKALAAGRGTIDIGGKDNTASFTAAIVELLD